MSGHSKWATIKRQKGAADAKRSTTFTKLANTITVAAREGGGDPTANFKLRLAIEKARQANMPKDNIDRAIKRGTGELGGAVFEHIVYEAYGPNGIAIMIDVNTDNRNRAVSNIKTLLNKANGKLAESGAVAYLFQQRGTMRVTGADNETMEMAIIESGAEDYEADESGYFVYTDPKATTQVSQVLMDAGLTVEDVELTMDPIAALTLDATAAQSVLRLVEQLEDLDDVSAVYTNLDLPEDLVLS